MCAIDDDDTQWGEYASPPCFLHELQPEFRGGQTQTDGTAWADVARWRKTERARLIKERLGVPPDERRTRSDKIATSLRSTITDLRRQLISVYWPLRGEPDLRQWMVDITRSGGRVALPVVVEKGSPLEFRGWSPGDPLERGVWNILVPSTGPAVYPTVLIAPVVGFDADNYRLGFGGGFFDRTLAAMPTKPRVIGVGFAQSRIASIYPQPHDIPMDLIVTEE